MDIKPAFVTIAKIVAGAAGCFIASWSIWGFLGDDIPTLPEFHIRVINGPRGECLGGDWAPADDCATGLVVQAVFIE